ncbi:hypothetical protein CFIMG_008386RA00001 [Ceratocystis fimbriata CBS 114723]|uniref:Corticosteroid-binding protein n=1 Tax=Ceratocystis fimbriata CBS 114723 TaxID=1035309 RepID=A0A2C5X4A4_9PEZI|nr:hypothetical protein CFIMG_008386RA00001 [Ceratocystis fimbriata CBS 114723]
MNPPPLTVSAFFSRKTWEKPPLAVFPFRVLLVIPALLAVLTAVELFVHSDLNLAMLFSQCHSRALLPGLSRIPIVGPLLCYLVSFFQLAATSTRGFAILAATLAYISGLLTVYTVEGARVCNKPAVVIAYPTGPLLVFILVGGAVVWELLIVPAFFLCSQTILRHREEATPETIQQAPEDDPSLGSKLRYFTDDAETVAIPAGVALGFILPSILMITLESPWFAALWLFSPVYVAGIRVLVRRVIAFQAGSLTAMHLESNRAALLSMYAAPVVVSVLAHWNLVWNLSAHSDDRPELTRSVLSFVVVDIIFVGLTILYWLFVEAGWQVAGVTLVVSVVAGPGAGVCVGWIYREQRMVDDMLKVAQVQAPGAGESPHGEEAEESRRDTDEETPLLS